MSNDCTISIIFRHIHYLHQHANINRDPCCQYIQPNLKYSLSNGEGWSKMKVCFSLITLSIPKRFHNILSTLFSSHLPYILKILYSSKVRPFDV